MKTKTIYLIVGGKIRTAQARIVGDIAEVETEYGIREFGVYHMSLEDAKKAVQKKKSRRGAAGGASEQTEG